MPINKFQESMLVFSAMKNNIENDLRVFKRHIQDEDLKFSLHKKMLIDISSFLDEWAKFKSYGKDTKIRETFEIVTPAIKRINKWKDIKHMRNTILAHGFRDKTRSKNLTCLNEKYFEANVPTTYAEVMLLSEFIVYIIATFICRHKEEHSIALASVPSYSIKEERGIDTMEEYNNDIKVLENQLFSKDPSLKDSFKE